MYLLGPLLLIYGKELGDAGKILLAEVWRVVSAFRLIGGFSAQPVDEAKLKEAQRRIVTFFRNMVRAFGPEWATYIHHNVSTSSGYLIYFQRQFFTFRF